MQEKVKEIISSQSEVNSQNILNDPLAQVFGLDTRGRVRGIGNVCRTQIIGSLTTIEKLNLNEKKYADQSTSIKNLETQVQFLIGEIGGLRDLIQVNRFFS